jgi:hypothetical protein
LRFFWLFVFFVLGLIGLKVANHWINNPTHQVRLVQWLYEKNQTKIDFEEISFDIFTGKISGKNIAINFERAHVAVSLNQFRIRFNPLYFLLAKIKFTDISAQEIYLDTSGYIKSDKSNKASRFPDFLQRIKLSHARIDNFFWQQANGNLAIKKLRLTSKFGSVLYKSPMHMFVRGVTYRGDKFDIFVDRLKQDGFFIFDLSRPSILDDSKIASKVLGQKILLGLHKEYKPWLTDRGWDEDLEPVLKRHYGDEIPKDRSYLFLDQVALDLEKNVTRFLLNSFKITHNGSTVFGSGNHVKATHHFNFNLASKEPLVISKLPLGQSKFRQSFENLSFSLKVNGSFSDFHKHDLGLSLDTALMGNLVNPESGDMTAKITGKIENGTLSSDNLSIHLKDGTIQGTTRTTLNDFTTHTTLNGKNFDAQTVVRLFSSINIPSPVDAQGSITGKINNPKISLDITSPNAAYEFLNFGPAHAKLLIDNKNLKLDVQSTDSDVGKSTLTLNVKNVFSSMEQVMDLKSDYHDVDVKKLLDAKHMTGKITGFFDLQRLKTIVSAKGEFTATDFAFFDQVIGDIESKVSLKEKHLSVAPIKVTLKNPSETVTSQKGFTFDFTDAGYDFSGSLWDTLKVSGQFRKVDKQYVNFEFIPQKTSLHYFASILPFTPDESTLTGKISLKYHIEDPMLSQMRAHLTELNILTPETKFTLNRAGDIDFNNKAFFFKSFDVMLGTGRVLFNGPLGLANNSALKITGKVDFNAISDFNPHIASSESPIDVDVTLKNDIYKPLVFGKITFQNDTLQFRKSTGEIDELTGILFFEGTRLNFQNIACTYDDAPLRLSGWITTDYIHITSADLAIVGKEVPFRPFDGLNILSDVNLKLTGTGNLTLSGQMNIIEGLYNRNFVITNFIVRPDEGDETEENSTLAMLPTHTRYKLQIRNTGDLLIKNNLAELEMNADLDMVGTLENPEMLGQLDFLNGSINAFGVDFEDASGFAQFKKGSGVIPEINLMAKKDIRSYEITARIEGRSENLRLRLDSSPALDRREILSVIFYGDTPDQLTEENRRQFTQTAAISQLAGILSQPIYKLSGLDVVKVTSRRETANQTIQRLSVGKSLSDRFDLTFTTDIGITEPERAFELRYQIFDNFYLIAAKDVTAERYRFDVNFHLDAY